MNKNITQAKNRFVCAPIFGVPDECNNTNTINIALSYRQFPNNENTWTDDQIQGICEGLQRVHDTWQEIWFVCLWIDVLYTTEGQWLSKLTDLTYNERVYTVMARYYRINQANLGFLRNKWLVIGLTPYCYMPTLQISIACEHKERGWIQCELSTAKSAGPMLMTVRLTKNLYEITIRGKPVEVCKLRDFMSYKNLGSIKKNAFKHLPLAVLKEESLSNHEDYTDIKKLVESIKNGEWISTDYL